MLTTEPLTPSSAWTSADFSVQVIALKLPEFWADNARVWFAQTEAQLAVRSITSSLTEFYYYVGTLGCADVLTCSRSHYCQSIQMSSLFSASSPKYGVLQDLPTVPGSPVFAKARHLDPGKLASAQAKFLKMEKAGILCRSSSPWSSPLHMVAKPDDTWRPCGDFCRLNTATVPDRYPLPSIADFSACIAGSKFFSKPNLQKGYFQVPMSPLTFPRPPSSPPLAYLSSSAFFLASVMLLRLSRG